MKAGATTGDRCGRRVAAAVLSLLWLSCSSDADSSDRTIQPPNGLPGAGSAGSAPNGLGPGAAASGSGNGAIDGDVPKPRPLSLEGDPIYTRFMRLTNEQWQRSVQSILGLTNAPDAARSFEEPVAGTTDFANNEHVLAVDNALWQSYQLASEQAAELATASAAALTRVYSGTDALGFIRTLGRRAFRRPLTAREEQSYAALFDAGQALPGTASAFAKGAGLVIRGLLQSPYFLYRTELGNDGTPLNGYEIASKLSFWLLGTTPSDALLDAAAAGQLDTADGGVTAAKQMIDQPAAAETVRQFHRELLHFDRYSTVSKIGVAAYTEALNAELEQSSYLFFDRIFKNGLGLREVFTSTTGYVGPQMARLYGIPAPASGMVERDLGMARAGYFAELPFLALYSFNEQPDPIHRGLTLNLDFLCADPGKPVANLPPIPALMPGQTNREMITTLTSGCGRQCHTYYINPLGFAFESFDGMGRLRTVDNGKPVDTSAAYPFSEGVKQFADAAQLMQLMANSQQAHACYAKKVAGYALQRDIVESDMTTLNALTRVSMAGSLKQVMLELVKDPAFRTRLGGKQ